jgi:hypothetical protein
MFDASVPEAQMLELLAALRPLAVSFERAKAHYFALDLEPEAHVDAVRDRLDGWAAEGLLAYETCEERRLGSFDDVPATSDTEA